jgi:hypothetical protein
MIKVDLLLYAFRPSSKELAGHLSMHQRLKEQFFEIQFHIGPDIRRSQVSDSSRSGTRESFTLLTLPFPPTYPLARRANASSPSKLLNPREPISTTQGDPQRS